MTSRKGLEELYRHNEAAQRWFSRLGGATLANLTAVLAVGAVVLYSAGLFRRIAQLRAEGVQTLRGIPLAPLQTYFVDGIAILFNPNSLATLAFIVLLLVAVASAQLWWPFVRPTRAAGSSDSTVTGEKRSDTVGHTARASAPPNSPTRLMQLVGIALIVLGIVGTVAAVIGILFFSPPAEWAPTLVALTPLIGLAVLTRVGLVPPRADWTPFYARIGALALGLTVILVVLMRAAFHPPALDVATLKLASGAVERGKLITQADGFVYLVGQPPDGQHERPIVAVPVARIARMEVRGGAPHYWKSLAERAGLRIFRIDVYDGEIKFRVLSGSR